MRTVLMLVNPKSGLLQWFDLLRRAMDRHWDVAGIDLHYQFSQSREDSEAKAGRAIAAGVDTILVAGGDGTVNTIGKALLGTEVKLGVIPLGSGNGFARHFEIPLNPERAAAALAVGRTLDVDVGVVNGRPFLVTCSMAWDASIVRSFERFPVRGIVPYVLAGVNEFFLYEVQRMEVQLDEDEAMGFKDALVFTVANLTQFGGGAVVAPQARADDGLLELVVVRRRDLPRLLSRIVLLFEGKADRVPEVRMRRFQRMRVRRERASQIQIDGELVDAGTEIDVHVWPRALKVLVPAL